jgi:hypothetical protein
LGTTFLTSSPEPTVSYLLESIIAMAGQLDRQLDLKKLFDADPHIPPLHLLRLRLLGYYSWAYEEHSDRSLLEDTESVIAKFASWGYPTHIVEQALQSLCSQGLLNPIKIGNPERLSTRISINSAGYAHVTRLASQKVYLTAMALITRWYDEDLVQEFIRQSEKAGTEEGTSLVDIVESGAVSIFEAYLKGARVREDQLLSKELQVQSWVQETLSRANSWDSNPSIEQQKKKQSAQTNQLTLDGMPQAEILPRLSRNQKLKGSVWVPRILWALEYARINRLGSLTAAQIANILTEEADIDVPKTNAARAFRDFAKNQDIMVYFTRHGKRYSITNEGSAIIRSIIQLEHNDDEKTSVNWDEE